MVTKQDNNRIIKNPSFQKWKNETLGPIVKYMNPEEYLKIIYPLRKDAVSQKPILQIYEEAAKCGSRVDISFIDFIIQPRSHEKEWLAEGLARARLKKSPFWNFDSQSKDIRIKIDYLAEIRNLTVKLSTISSCPEYLPRLFQLITETEQKRIEGNSKLRLTLNTFCKKWLPINLPSSKGGRPLKDAPYLVAQILAAHLRERTGGPHYSVIGDVLDYTFPELMKRRSITYKNKEWYDAVRLYCSQKNKFGGAYQEYYNIYKAIHGTRNVESRP